MKSNTSDLAAAVIGDFCERTRTVERRFVASGFLAAVEMHDASVRARLTGQHFFDSVNSALWAYVCFAAKHGFRPMPDQAAELLAELGLTITGYTSLDATEIYWLIFGAGTCEGQTDIFAMQVARQAEMRWESSDHVKAAGEVMESKRFGALIEEDSRCNNRNGRREPRGRNRRPPLLWKDAR